MTLLDDRRNGIEERRDGGFAIPTTLWLWFIQFMISGLLIYAAVNARVSVVEAKQIENERRLQRIEDKVDRLLDMAVRR